MINNNINNINNTTIAITITTTTTTIYYLRLLLLLLWLRGRRRRRLLPKYLRLTLATAAISARRVASDGLGARGEGFHGREELRERRWRRVSFGCVDRAAFAFRGGRGRRVEDRGGSGKGASHTPAASGCRSACTNEGVPIARHQAQLQILQEGVRRDAEPPCGIEVTVFRTSPSGFA